MTFIDNWQGILQLLPLSMLILSNQICKAIVHHFNEISLKTIHIPSRVY